MTNKEKKKFLTGRPNRFHPADLFKRVFRSIACVALLAAGTGIGYTQVAQPSVDLSVALLAQLLEQSGVVQLVQPLD